MQKRFANDLTSAILAANPELRGVDRSPSQSLKDEMGRGRGLIRYEVGVMNGMVTLKVIGGTKEAIFAFHGFQARKLAADLTHASLKIGVKQGDPDAD